MIEKLSNKRILIYLESSKSKYILAPVYSHSGETYDSYHNKACSSCAARRIKSGLCKSISKYSSSKIDENFLCDTVGILLDKSIIRFKTVRKADDYMLSLYSNIYRNKDKYEEGRFNETKTGE